MTATLVRDTLAFEWGSGLAIGLLVSKVSLVTQRHKPCKKEMNRDDYGECLLTSVEDELINDENETCTTPHFNRFFNKYKNLTCTDSEQISRVARMTRAKYLTHRTGQSQCDIPCSQEYYEGKTLPFTLPSTGGELIEKREKMEVHFVLSLDKMNGQGLAVLFISSIVIESDEYYIYEFVDILSSVGGALGMFLGWSFYQNFQFLWTRIRRHFPTTTT